jgi:antitoxin VapB
LPLYVRDNKARDLARRLAEQRRCTVTEAVRDALREALERDSAEIEERRQRAREILQELDSLPRLRPGVPDDDLYDERGMPVL